MGIWKRWECRTVRQTLWDYAGERLSEGPMERVERHIENCTGCRQEMQAFRSAQSLLLTARQESPVPARSGWGDLQQRIAEDVAINGPVRPARADTRRVAAQLLGSRRRTGFQTLLPRIAAAGSFALACGIAGFMFRSGPAPQNSAVQNHAVRNVPAPVTVTAQEPQPADTPDTPTGLSSFGLPFLLMPTMQDAPAVPQKPTVQAVRKEPTPAAAAVASVVQTAKDTPKQTAKAKSVPTKPPTDDRIHFAEGTPTGAEKAPDASAVPPANGVMGTLTPVSYDSAY